jgi:formate hydrogenlyase transcriptional activator
MKSRTAVSGPTCFTASRSTPSPSPPLRKHREDIELLVWHFIAEINTRVGKDIDQIPPSVMQTLTEMDYPGNVRELKNLLEHAVITSANGVLQLPETSPRDTTPGKSAPHADSPVSLDDIQRMHITHVLDHTDGRIEGPGGAAEILGLKPSTLRHRIKKLEIEWKKQTSQ